MTVPNGLKKHWPMLASVVLFGLAFPPVNLSLMVFIALAPWFAFLRDCTEKEARQSGYWFGAILFLFQMSWLVPVVENWTGSAAMGWIPLLICGFLAGWFYLLVGWLINRAWAYRRWWAIPLLWAGLEAFRAYIPGLAFPWSNSAVPLWHLPAFVQHAAFGTVFFVSAWTVIPNLLLTEWLFAPKEGHKQIIYGQGMFRSIMVFCALLIASALRFSQPPEGVTKTIVLGQPGIDMAFTTPEEEKQLLEPAIVDLSLSAAGMEADLLIMPEGVIAATDQLPPPSPFGDKPIVPILVGGNFTENGKTYQSAFSYDGEWSVSNKTRLVVFGEYVPLRDVLPLDGFSLMEEDLTPGEVLKTPEINGMKVGAFLCFEGLFPDLGVQHCLNGAQLMAVMSIDDWYMDSPAFDQLWMSSVWRSIESGLPLMRVGAQGRTLFTDSRGSVIAGAPIGEQSAVRAVVKVPDESDAFNYRFLFVYLCWLTMVLVAVEAIWKKRKSLRISDAESDSSS